MVIDIFLIILGIIFTILGILGCILPVIPGPPISFIALIMLHLAEKGILTTSFLWSMAFIAIAVTILDYIVPVWGTKKFGGSKRSSWGATVGLIIGLFIGPWGIILGPFAGATIAELIGGADQSKALKAGFGAFIGFLLGVGMKLIASGFMAWHFFKGSFGIIKGYFQ